MDDKDNLRKNNVVGGGDSQDYLRGNIAPSALPNNSNSRLQKATSQTKAPRRRRISRAHIIGLIGFLVVVATFVALLLTGVMYVGFKEPKAIVNKRVTVCDAKVIDKYSNMNLSSGSNDFDELVKFIKSKSGYEQDATCQYILFAHAIYKFDIASAKSTMKIIENLRKDLLYPDDNAPLPSFDDMKRQLKMMEE